MSSHRSKHFFLILFLILLSIPVFFFFVWHRAMHGPLLTQGKETSIIVQPGSTIHDLASALDRRGLITHPGIFVFDAKIHGDSRKLRYGEYRIFSGMTASQLLSNVTSGKGLVPYQVTFVEGWTFRAIKKLLLTNPKLRHNIKGKTNKAIMSLLGYPGQHPEGRFFPDTYTFAWGNSDLTILRHAYRRMQSFLSAQWKQRAVDLPYRTAYQALIVASLIEKETSIPEERSVIAGVILNRLHKGMRLQVDPTVLYGVKKPYGTVITKKDLQSKNAYNTYHVYGLPPTPIDMPSAASIIAALHPKKTSYLFYVARKDGSHEFSSTYRQHLKAVKRYREFRSRSVSPLTHWDSSQVRYDILRIIDYILRV